AIQSAISTFCQLGSESLVGYPLLFEGGFGPAAKLFVAGGMTTWLQTRMPVPPLPGIQPLCSLAHMMVAAEICRMLLRHWTCCAAARARRRAGSSTEIRRAMLPIATNN